MGAVRSAVLNTEAAVGESVVCAGRDRLGLLAAQFDELYALVHRFLLHRVWDAELAEELAAQTFYRLACSLRRYGTDTATLRAGALRIATNVANTNYRRQRLHRLLWSRLPFTRLRHSAERADCAASASDEANRVRAALRSLKAHHQTVLVLRYYLDLSYAQMADVLGCREQTARARTSRAVRRLRERLGFGLTPGATG